MFFQAGNRELLRCSPHGKESRGSLPQSSPSRAGSLRLPRGGRCRMHARDLATVRNQNHEAMRRDPMCSRRRCSCVRTPERKLQRLTCVCAKIPTVYIRKAASRLLLEWASARLRLRERVNHWSTKKRNGERAGLDSHENDWQARKNSHHSCGAHPKKAQVVVEGPSPQRKDS